MPEKSANKTVHFVVNLLQWIFPLILIVLIEVAKLSQAFIENYYTNGLYAYISNLLRTLFGWCPFSLGDLFYYIIIFQFIFCISKGIFFLFKSKIELKKIVIGIKKGMIKLMWIYIVFNIFWGLNYYRLGITSQLKLEREDYTKADVENIVCDLVSKLNNTRKQIGQDSLRLPNDQKIYRHCISLYDSVNKSFSFIDYRHPSVKKSLFSSISNYIGFTGYYNPFSGEAQVTTDVPKILIPYITCHEIAHQIGYASEDEANFTGYLVCSNSNDLYFQYSVYMDLYKYAAVELLSMDANARHGWELDSLVRKDFRDIRNFFSRKSNKISPVMGQLYGQYLKANQQSKGLDSYNDVVGLLIAYKKKFEKI
jgi:hypothetical protein